MVLDVLKRKAKRLYPVMVEGKFTKRVDNTMKQTKTWLDQKIGFENRCLLSARTPVVPNRILFITFQHAYACNPKYICEELVKRDGDYEIYWAIDNLLNPGDIPKLPNVHIVKMNSYDYFEVAVSARVIVINSLLGDKFYPFPLQKGQIVIETWHGSLGIKRFDPAHYNTNVTWPEAAKRTGRLTKYCISNSSFEEDVFRETFWPETRILRLGHARNDIFFDGYREKRAQWREEFLQKNNLPEDIHLALYAPTFRDTHNFDVYDLNADRVLNALRKRFGGDWRLLVRYHDNDKKNEAKKNTVLSPDVIDVTKLPDIQELLAFIDCGITDYSSWIYDFILARKPGFIYARDAELYNDERGFYFKLEESPFPVATENAQMEENILNFDNDLYLEKVEAFLEGKGCMDDGHASERIADRLEHLLK